jgi:maltose alpha-D-glucosyltransferase/alpha-amylase
MQWNPDRNAGFSAANPQRLFLPVIIDSEYHFSAVNVEVEQNSPHSLLWWMRRIIHLRQRYKAFGRGTLEFLQPDNSKVLAYIREYAGETILIVANLSRFAQCAELDLGRFRGQVPTEMFGQTKFPPIGELPYFLTLGPYAFYWFRLEWSAAEAGGPMMETRPRLEVAGSWDAALADPAVGELEQVLPAWLRRRRWFGGKARTVQHVEIEESVPLGDSKEEPLRVVIARVDYTEGEPERYMLPLIFAAEERARNITGDHPGAALALVHLTGGRGRSGAAGGESRMLCEAVWERDFWRPLMTMVEKKRGSDGRGGAVVTEQSKAFRELHARADGIDPHVHGGQQSNTSAIFGDALILKLFRKLSPGENPDLEISRFLTENGRHAPVPAMAGAVEYAPQRGEPMTLAVLHEFVANEGDAWVHTLDDLGRYFERVTSDMHEEGTASPTLPKGSLLEAARSDPPEVAHEMIGPYLQEVALLGRRTAEMHLALASDDTKPNFRPEPFTKLYQRSLYQSMRAGARRVFTLLRRQRSKLEETARPLAGRVLELEDAVVERYRAVLDRKISARRIRCHGDLHLGQILYTGKDFVFIDFEGEPDRTITERRIKASPLKDVAGMLRSFHYASFAARFGQIPGVEIGPEAREAAVPWMQFWYAWCAATYLRHYLETARTGDFLPQDDSELETLLDAYVLEKTVYEIGYELNNRPDWVRIPLEGVLDLVGAGS